MGGARKGLKDTKEANGAGPLRQQWPGYHKASTLKEIAMQHTNHTRNPSEAPARALEAKPQGDAIDWLESLDADAWADACEEIAAAQNARALEAQGGAQ